MKKILLVYPEYPANTYWSFRGTMPYLGRRASMPPLGLITVAALLPSEYEVRLVDMNVEPLRDDHLYWADLVFTSTMIVQAVSLTEVIRRAKRIGVPVVVGGPHPSTAPDGIPGADHLVAGEAEVILPEFLADLEQGRLRPEYRTSELPSLSATPPPRFDLLKLDAYATMPVQYSRGCPFSCEFCDIWKIYGRRPRTKEPEQFLVELDRLHALGWQRSVFIVDDNFIGNPRKVKPFLAHVARWQRENGYPFDLFTEATVNLANDEELLQGMRKAGFSMVFLGIETPSIESLAGSNKILNTRTDLLECVRRVQEAGMEVAGGFIVGFDDDTEDIFERQVRFIESAGIPMAMVGVLTAVPGTDLYDRVKREGRLLEESGGNNTHTFRANFTPRMPVEVLASGYRTLIGTLYDRTLHNYFRRCRTLLKGWGPSPNCHRTLGRSDLRAFLLSLATIPVRPFGREFARFLLWTIAHRRHRFAEAVRLGIMGFHFQAITEGAAASDELRTDYAEATGRMRDRVDALREDPGEPADAARALHAERRRLVRKFKRRIRRLAPSFRPEAETDYGAFLAGFDALLADAVPAAAPARPGGADLLEEIRAFFEHEEEALSRRYQDLRERAARGIEDLNQATHQLYEEQRRKLREARRRLRLLPSEYRDIARREYEAFRLNLTLMAVPI